MKNSLSLSQYFDNIGVKYLIGALSKCWETWRYENIVPGYDKFYYILDGEFYLKIDSKKYIARKGQLFLLPYNSTQTYYHISENHVTKYWLHCTLSCKEHDLLELITLPHFIQVDDPEYVTSLFRQILSHHMQPNLATLSDRNSTDITADSSDLYGSGPAFRLRQSACILQLLAYYIDKSDLTDENTVIKDSKLGTLMAYIEKNLQNPISINELCAIVHFHPNYFIRYFKEATGLSPMNYINNLRIETAKKLLQSEKDSIKSISFSVGFKSPYYFSRIFKEKTGFTPSDYRLISNSKPTGTLL